jgi:hypothetical protein
MAFQEKTLEKVHAVQALIKGGKSPKLACQEVGLNVNYFYTVNKLVKKQRKPYKRKPPLAPLAPLIFELKPPPKEVEIIKSLLTAASQLLESIGAEKWN